MTRTRGKESIYTKEYKNEMAKKFVEEDGKSMQRYNRYLADASALMNTFRNDEQALFTNFKESLTRWADLFPSEERVLPKLCLLVVKTLYETRRFPYCGGDIIKHQIGKGNLIDSFPKLKDLFESDDIDMSIFDEKVTATIAVKWVDHANLKAKLIKPALVAMMALYYVCEHEAVGRGKVGADFFQKFNLYKK